MLTHCAVAQFKNSSVIIFIAMNLQRMSASCWQRVFHNCPGSTVKTGQTELTVCTLVLLRMTVTLQHVLAAYSRRQCRIFANASTSLIEQPHMSPLPDQGQFGGLGIRTGVSKLLLAGTAAPVPCKRGAVVHKD